mmetsp:Transcript_18276/g.36996  ORF Transcript_18276/g.36996 Transcript_18276/m.36996 type:complete len:240 (+) Transcript_18276:4996-5715(+)
MEQDCWCWAPNCTGKIRRLPSKGKGTAAPSGAAAPSGSPSEPPPKKRARAEEQCVQGEVSDAVPAGETRAEAMVEGTVVLTEREGSPASQLSSEAAPTAGQVVVKVEQLALPSDEEVLTAMESIALRLNRVRQTDDVGSVTEGELTWRSLHSWFQKLPDPEVCKDILTSSHADNIRAFLAQRGAPFVMPEGVQFPSQARKRGEDTDAAASAESDRAVVIDLTTPPTSPRLDESDATGGV